MPAYTIVYRKKAKIEFAKFEDIYGNDVSKMILDWLGTLAQEAERKQYKISFDAKTLLEMIENEPNPDRWGKAFERWLNESTRSKIKAILTVLSSRRPPWEFRRSEFAMRFLDYCRYDAEVYYEIDHVEKRIIITAIDLPGPSERVEL